MCRIRLPFILFSILTYISVFKAKKCTTPQSPTHRLSSPYSMNSHSSWRSSFTPPTEDVRQRDGRGMEKRQMTAEWQSEKGEGKWAGKVNEKEGVYTGGRERGRRKNGDRKVRENRKVSSSSSPALSPSPWHSSSFSLPFLLPWSFVPHRLAIKSPFHKTTSKSKHFCNILQEKSAIILRQVFFAKFSRKNCNKNSYLKKNFLFPTNNKITITG